MTFSYYGKNIPKLQKSQDESPTRGLATERPFSLFSVLKQKI
jgi:hypothetical protein